METTEGTQEQKSAVEQLQPVTIVGPSDTRARQRVVSNSFRRFHTGPPNQVCEGNVSSTEFNCKGLRCCRQSFADNGRIFYVTPARLRAKLSESVEYLPSEN